MLVVMRVGAGKREIEKTAAAIRKLGLKPNIIPGSLRTAIGITGNKGAVDPERLRALPGVAELIRVTKPYKLVNREMKPEDTVVDVSGVKIGGGRFAVMAGPCAVEDRTGALKIARAVRRAGAVMFRGGAYKPRTSPYSFQGLGRKGLEILREVREETGLRIVTEAIDPESLEQVARAADMIQIGARNMQNYSLLRLAGETGMPVLLKRGFSATFEELLMAAEYILDQGNYNVVLCERGVRTFADHTRSTLDLSLVPAARRTTHLPVLVDPSHAAGRRYMVPELSRAALAVGAQGLLVEVHHSPEKAMSDGPQSMDIPDFSGLMKSLTNIGRAVGVPMLKPRAARRRSQRRRR
ncbi:MAG: 3-deoxy-7-phosphoheptulonate synthase [Planctomycetota bacterium]|jgi:3-deoxy-7-phosphoheptulonate synthase